MTRRAATVATRAEATNLPWKRNLFIQLQAPGAPRAWARVLREVAIFRDRWNITDQNLPLGTQPPWEEFQKTHHRQRILATIEAARHRGLDQPAMRNGPVSRQPQRVSAQYDGPQL